MTLTDLQPWVSPMLFALSMFYTWVTTRDKDNSQHIKAVEEALSKRIAEHAARLAEHQTKLEHLQTVQAHMPTHKDMAELQRTVAALTAVQTAANEELKGARASIELVRNFLMNNPIPKTLTTGH